MTLAPITILAKGACAAATFRRELRPVSALVIAGLVVDVLREALGSLVLRPARVELGPGVPYSGWTRAVFHADQALFLVAPFAVAALSWWAWRKASPMRAAVVWGAVGLVAVTKYPGLRGDALGTFYGLVTAGCVLWSLAAVALRRERAGALQLVSLLLVAGECATLAGPYLSRPFASWGLGQVTWTLTFAAASLVALGARWMRPA